MSKYDRDAIEIYILDHIDTDDYKKLFITFMGRGI